MKTSTHLSVIILRSALLTAALLIPGAVLLAADAPPKPGHPDAPQAQAETQTQQRLISLVLLLAEPRTLDAGAVAHAVSHATGTEVTEHAVVAKGSSFVVKAGPRKFVIHSVGDPYFEEGGKLAEEVKDPALAGAIRKHRAWLSVDWLERDEQVDLRKVYQQIGQIIAQLVKADTLAVYSPDTDQFHLNDKTLLGHLKSEDPLQDLIPAGLADAGDTITISRDDPKLKAAEAEAKEHWPEFLHAFKERSPGQYFAVKGRILEGDKGEYLWLQVTDVDDKVVHGKVDNDPTMLKKVVRGADLHIPIAEVDDWLYNNAPAKGESAAKVESKGGYTLRVFDQIAKSKRGE